MRRDSDGMLHFDATAIDCNTVQWGALELDHRLLSFGDVAGLWCSNVEFRRAWIQALRGITFASYCWECPPISARDLNRPFECVFIDSPLLTRARADPDPFREHFAPGVDVVGFASLGKDAWLIAPCPQAEVDCTHLARFMATAGEESAVALWRAVGEALRARVAATPLWLSTAGLGVSWLHVRLDSRPKYYRHDPYKRVRA
jgi:hypothetical protein